MTGPLSGGLSSLALASAALTGVLVGMGACGGTITVGTAPGADADLTGDDATELVEVDAAPDAAPPPPDAPPPPEPWSFAVFGDNQFSTTSCTSGVSERLAIPKAMLELAPDFLVHVGDLMDHGYEDGAYDHFVSCYQELLAATPLFPTMGNHDAGSGAVWDYKTFLESLLATRNPAAWGASYATDFTTWYEDDPNTYSTTPSDPGSTADVPSGFSFKTYYAFKFKNAYFISMEVGTMWWSDTPVSWLGDHLTAAGADPEVEHIFVDLHHPIYSTTMSDDGSGDTLSFVREHYEPLFAATPRLRVVFAGHAHVYDRTYVPFDHHATRASPPPATYPLGEGIQYMVVGGGGGPLPDCSSFTPVQQTSWAYSQLRYCGYHFAHVAVRGSAISVEGIAVDGSESSYTTTTVDSFRIE